MNTTKPDRHRRKPVGVLAGALVLLSLASVNPLAAAPSSAPRRADPIEKGATRLRHHPASARLPSETNSPVLAPLAAQWHRLAPELVRCPTTRSNHTVNLAIHRIRQAPGRPVLVFIHGLLSDHLTWEYVAAALAADYELWLVDLPGCGDSDAPKPSAIEPDGYSPTAMGERVWQALRVGLAAEASAAPRPLTLVGHSLGGTVVIRMVSAPELQASYAAELEHVARAVLLAPCDLAINSVPPQFRTLQGLKGWKVTAGNALGVFDGQVRDLTKASYHLPDCATGEQQAFYAHALKDPRHREAGKAMLREFVRFDPKTLRPVWPCIDPLVADYENIRIPVLIVYGAWDETLPSAMGHQLKDQIPGAVLVKLPGRGHALPTEDPLTCAMLIQRFQQGRGFNEVASGLGAKVYRAPAVVEEPPLLSSTVQPGPQATIPAAVP
jgi:pimeloyl-ACP methyl ester carboxylesterase